MSQPTAIMSLEGQDAVLTLTCSRGHVQRVVAAMTYFYADGYEAGFGSAADFCPGCEELPEYAAGDISAAYDDYTVIYA